MKSPFVSLITLIIYLFCSTNLVAQNNTNKYNFRRYSVNNGLPSNTVRSIIQDRQGYIWIGTEDGLCRFDGISFLTYSSNNSTHKTPANYINSIAEDMNETIWIATNKGIFYKKKNETIFSSISSMFPNENIGTEVYQIAEDGDNNLWFATFNKGLYKINISKHTIKNYDFSETSQMITGIYIDSKQNIYAITRNTHKMLYKYSHTKDEFSLVKMDLPDNKSNSFLTVLEETEHYLWIGTWEGGLKKLNRYNGHVSDEVNNSNATPLNHIHSMTRFDNHTIFIGSDDGLMIYDTNNKKCINVTPDEFIQDALSDRFVYPIFKDREGGIWIGTYYGGVNYLSPTFSQFNGYSHSRFNNSVSGKVISCFSEDSKGNIWIGSDDGGLSKFDPKTNIFTKQANISYKNVHSLLADGDNLWIGTYTGGLNVLNLSTGKIKVYSNNYRNVNTLDDNSVYSMLKDSKGNIWIATMNGINLYKENSDSFYRMKSIGCTTGDICEDNNGNIWFATLGKGILRYNPDGDVWTNYTYENTKHHLNDNIVNTINLDEEQNLWFGTNNGLCRFDYKSNSFIQIKMDIPSNNITAIVDYNNSLWLTTAKGVVCYQLDKKATHTYTKSDGLQSEQFLPSSILKASDGKIYIGSVDGFNTFYPHNLTVNRFVPPVVITGVSIMNKLIDITGDIIDISYGENMFTLQFAALSYCIPSKNSYAYKLEGFDNDWIFVGNKTSATYTNLPAGTYTFRVKGCNNDKLWNEKGASLTIVIHPPFYLTVPFKIFYLLLFIGSILYIYYFLHKRTEKRHQNNINQINKRNEEEMHKAKIAFFTMIAHEIRTPVSLIIGPLEKIMKGFNTLPPDVGKDLEIINRNSNRLLLLVNQLLDFRKVEKGNFKMKFNKINIYQLLETVYARFQPSAVNKGINMKMNCEDNQVEVCVDSEAVTKIISNLLTNALKFTRDSIVIDCKCHWDNRTISIMVSDNGCGIAKEQQEKIFKPFFQTSEGETQNGTGIGLHIVKTLVENHMGEIKLESELKKGSTFEIILPIDHETDEDESETSDNITTENHIVVNEKNDKSQSTILIVEDNTDMLDFLKSNFEDEYNVLTAINGKEGLDILNKQDINLIISDWMMPEMDGLELCKKVRLNPLISHLPFILLTAKTDNMSKIESMNSGADLHIEKPFSIDFLKACIKNTIQLRSNIMLKLKESPLNPLNEIAKTSADKKFIDKVNSIIEENFSNGDLNIDLIAEKLNMSRSSFFSKIKTVTDVTPNELIQIVRMKKAVQLLLEQKYRINEICYMVGFNNPSYFSKCFQKQFGVKPQEFIQQHNNQ